MRFLPKPPYFLNFVQLQPKAIDKIAATAIRHDKQLFDAAAATVTPVKHTLIIEAIK